MPAPPDGRLPKLGLRPNQVTTQDEELRWGAWQKLEPLPFDGDVDAAADRLIEVAKSFERTAFVERDGLYLSFTFSTRWFTDDVEFLIAPDEGVVHFRSASRLGWGDKGVNRRRMKRFSSRWADSGA